SGEVGGGGAGQADLGPDLGGELLVGELVDGGFGDLVADGGEVVAVGGGLGVGGVFFGALGAGGVDPAGDEGAAGVGGHGGTDADDDGAIAVLPQRRGAEKSRGDYAQACAGDDMLGADVAHLHGVA